MKLLAYARRRATCPTRPAGAVLVTSDNTEFIGYEGAPHKIAHCDVIGCRIIDSVCHHAVRAEINAVLQAAVAGQSTKQGTLYITHPLAADAVGAVINAGVTKVVCPEPVSRGAQETLRLAEVELELTNDHD